MRIASRNFEEIGKVSGAFVLTTNGGSASFGGGKTRTRWRSSMITEEPP